MKKLERRDLIAAGGMAAFGAGFSQTLGRMAEGVLGEQPERHFEHGRSPEPEFSVDPATGKSSVLLSEQAAPKSWITLTDNYRFLRDGSLIWWSERDGFGHLYRFKGGRWTQLTQGPWVVSKLVGVDEAKGSFVFEARADTVLENQVWRGSLSGKGKPVRLTEAGFDNMPV